MEERDAPGDGGAPVVACEEEAGLIQLIGDGKDIGSEMGKSVRRGAARFAAGVVAALIGNDDTETGGSERIDLMSPGIPEFGEAVEEKDERAVGRARSDGVEFDGAVAEQQMFKR